MGLACFGGINSLDLSISWDLVDFSSYMAVMSSTGDIECSLGCCLMFYLDGERMGIVVCECFDS